MHDNTGRKLRTHRFTELLVSRNHKSRYTFARETQKGLNFTVHGYLPEIGHLIAFRILVPGTGVSGIKLEGIYTLEMAQVLSKRIFVEKHLSLDYKFARLCQSRVNSFRTHNPERLDL